MQIWVWVWVWVNIICMHVYYNLHAIIFMASFASLVYLCYHDYQSGKLGDLR